MGRWSKGGFEDRYRITRTDGKPMKDTARYLVLNYAEDPHARTAIEAYANSIEPENDVMANDLRNALVNPEKYPSQHD